MKSEVIALVEGRLYALANAFELDGRVSTHPAQARGFASMNCYLLIEDGHALMIDMGLAAHREALLAQLDSLIDRATPLSLWSLRIGEFNSIGNVCPIVERFNVVSICAAVPAAGRWVDLHTMDATLQTALDTRVVKGGDVVNVDPSGHRAVDVLPAPLRLLPTNWAYDRATRTLFTSDAFTHAWREELAQPCCIAAGEADPVTERGVRDYLRDGRFWWVEQADTRPIQAEIQAIFDRCDVDVIAPGFGCVLRGREVVRRHREVMEAIL